MWGKRKSAASPLKPKDEAEVEAGGAGEAEAEPAQSSLMEGVPPSGAAPAESMAPAAEPRMTSGADVAVAATH